MQGNQILKASLKEVIDMEFLDISDINKIQEYDLRNVRGSVRLRSGNFVSAADVNLLRSSVKQIRYPKK